MSVSAALKLSIYKKSTQISWVEIIQYLLSNGWSLNDHNMMTYLPLHDNDMYDWKREQINEKCLMKILTDKENAKEPLGVCVIWKGSNTGGSFQTLSDEEMLFSISINRKTIQLCEGKTMTDVNWYLLRINSILSQMKDIQIVSTEFFEYV